MDQPRILYLSRADVEEVGLPMSTIIQVVEEMFVEKGKGWVELPPKPGIHPGGDSFIHAMPAWVPAARAAAMKWVSAFPGNRARGLPQISGLIVLNDPDTGLPEAVMDCTWITAMRTAAATAVAARRLARPESSVLGIIGCGVQARSHVEALQGEFELSSVRVYDHRPENMDRFARETGERFGLEVRPCPDPETALAGADLIVTGAPILKDPDPLILPEWVAEGSFACALDFDSSFSAAAMEGMDRLVADDVAQLDHYRSVGYFGETPARVEELAHMVTGVTAGRRTPTERILSLHLGLASEDAVTARALVDRAREMGIGTSLPA
jgi:ornithine cyclodeaminase/alanine dehydrogenase